MEPREPAAAAARRITQRPAEAPEPPKKIRVICARNPEIQITGTVHDGLVVLGDEDCAPIYLHAGKAKALGEWLLQASAFASKEDKEIVV